MNNGNEMPKYPLHNQGETDWLLEKRRKKTDLIIFSVRATSSCRTTLLMHSIGLFLQGDRMRSAWMQNWGRHPKARRSPTRTWVTIKTPTPRTGYESILGKWYILPSTKVSEVLVWVSACGGWQMEINTTVCYPLFIHFTGSTAHNVDGTIVLILEPKY